MGLEVQMCGLWGVFRRRHHPHPCLPVIYNGIQTAGGKGVTHQGEEVLQDQALKDSHDL